LEELSRKRFGYHVVYDDSIDDAIDFASKQGFGYIVPDLMVPRFFPEQFSRRERHRIREVAASEDVSISLHGPSDYLNLGTIYPEVGKAVLHRMRSCLTFARDIEAERFTIHLDPPYDFVLAGKEGAFLRDHWTLYKNAMKESLRELVKISQGNVLICVENDRLGSMAMEVLNELLPEKELFLAWDIPKSNTNGKPNLEIENFLIQHLEMVKECHLHDQKPGKHSHDIIGVSNIDFSHYLKKLVPQNVYFTIEVRPREKALESLNTISGMLKDLGWKIPQHD